MRKLRTSTLALLVAVTTACAGRLAAPQQLGPAGATAFHADRAIKGISVLQDVVIAGEANKAISTNDARIVMAATEVAGKGGQDLAAALRAGSAGVDARQRAILAIRAALTNVAPQLSPDVRKVVEPYIAVVMTALTFIN